MHFTKFHALALACGLLFAACGKDDNSKPSIDPQAPASGTWKVTLFTDDNKNETSEFSAYTFTFNSTGTMVATKAGVDKAGTWSITGSKFNIDMGAKGDANKPLGELTDDWRIISVTSSQIKLQDDNEASGEQLTFSKN